MSEKQIAMVAETLIHQFMMGRVYLTTEGENRLYKMIEERKRVEN